MANVIVLTNGMTPRLAPRATMRSMPWVERLHLRRLRSDRVYGGDGNDNISSYADYHYGIYDTAYDELYGEAATIG